MCGVRKLVQRVREFYTAWKIIIIVAAR